VPCTISDDFATISKPKLRKQETETMAVRHDSSPNALSAARRREAKKPMSGRGSGLTPRIKKAIEAYAHGIDADGNLLDSQEDVAAAAGISARALRAALLKPAVMAYYRDQCVLFREMKRAPALRVIAEMLDDATLKASPAGQKVRLTAAERIAFDTPNTSVNVNVGVGVSVNGEKAGYVIDLTPSRERTEQPAPQVIEAEPAPAWRELGD
jgi:hypothetical protein